jgi:hypothetical protein
MSNIFQLAGNTHGNSINANRTGTRPGKFEAVTAAMLSGGASGGWRMARALRPRKLRDDVSAQPERSRRAACEGRRSAA